MIENVGFISQEGLVPQGGLHRGYTFLVLFEGEVGKTLLVEDLRVATIDAES